MLIFLSWVESGRVLGAQTLALGWQFYRSSSLFLVVINLKKKKKFIPEVIGNGLCLLESFDPILAIRDLNVGQTIIQSLLLWAHW